MSSHVTKHVGIISKDTRNTISARYRTVTKASNSEFWNSTSETAHSLYVGSYGRGTAVDTSDIDILLELPQAEYERYISVPGRIVTFSTKIGVLGPWKRDLAI
ncbi:hypothetical protein DYP60_13225 [Sphaerochaeta halotolerans]|uniref:Uncharacterized protein n=1 Tax=Sphaerochaeta halotolerans TaxID=2293840 RepID=A0A372MEK8_9SPIR|nr:hypothetical protein DYP60_13225 [Sphaerochaeta halotolerans]